MSDFFVCPNCQAEVKKTSKVCPNCGSDEQTGWSDLTYLDGISLPDDGVYEEVKDQEFSEKRTLNRYWVIITASIVLLITVVMIISGVF